MIKYAALKKQEIFPHCMNNLTVLTSAKNVWRSLAIHIVYMIQLNAFLFFPGNFAHHPARSQLQHTYTNNFSRCFLLSTHLTIILLLFHYGCTFV